MVKKIKCPTCVSNYLEVAPFEVCNLKFSFVCRLLNIFAHVVDNVVPGAHSFKV